MTTAHATTATTGLDAGPADGPDIGRAEITDGAELWRIARESGELDVNSPYSYLLWCRDFAGTTAVARDATGRPVGFVTGYLRPEAPGTLFVWQVAVEGSHRGTGVAGALLDSLSARVAAEHGLVRIEATVTPGNVASDRMFRSFARRHGAGLTREVLFPAAVFPVPAGTGEQQAPHEQHEPHEPEVLYRIGPLTA
ncbi:diaminobutyrate acetyltransferase [Streptomyces sp. NPDC004327]|uniref:diaminobutyrate acetyltransferase n=1 Tax=unclassified Streptomyces TaxID=2593676 RepID=UPI003687B6B5